METEQEIFDKVVTHFLVEKQPFSYMDHNHGTECYYRGDNNAKCAVGIFIPDDIYDGRIEGRDLKSLIEWLQKNHQDHPFTLLLSKHEKLFQRLQIAHDGYIDRLYCFWCELKNIAECFNLNTDLLNQYKP